MGKSLSLPRQLGILAIESSWEDYSVKKLVSFKTGLHPVNFANKLPRAKRIEQIFLRSLWSGKGENPSEMCCSVAIQTEFLTQKIMVNWSTFLTMNCYILVGLPSVEANLKKDDLLKYGISDFFTKEILQICSEVSFNLCLILIDHYLSSSLWRNSLIKIDYRPVFFFINHGTLKALKMSLI